MSKKQNWTVISLFLVMIFGLTVATLLKPDSEFSEKENRVLAQKPKLAVDSYFSGEFSKDYETYMTDQFLFRDQWIQMKTAVERASLKQEIKGIYFAQDGYLIEKHEDSFQSATASNNIQHLARFMEEVQGEYGDGHVTAMVVPNAVEILKDKLPPLAPDSKEGEYLEYIADALPAGTWFDAADILNQHKEEEIYYRTDHHWKTLGAYYTYEAWAKSVGLSPLKKEEYEVETVTNNFLGTIEAKVGTQVQADSIQIFRPKEEEKYTISYNRSEEKKTELYDWSYLETKDQYSIFFGGNQPLVEDKIDNGSARRLLVIKDSYAHCFLPFTFHDFSQVDFVDLRYFNESLREYREKGNYTDILFLYNASGFAEDPNVVKLGN